MLSNREIDGTISLTSLADDGLGGWFDVSAVTSHSPSYLKFPFISPRAKLDLTSHTTFDNALVDLDKAYEGGFKIETTPAFKAFFNFWPSYHSDPEHKDRKRAGLVFQPSDHEVHGRAWWGEEDKGTGSVEVMTTNGKVQLRL